MQLSGDASDVAAPAGSKSGRKATGAPLPNALAGALIGRIGNGQAFAIGNQTTVQMPAAGQLFLGVNDDGFDDNQGEFRVDITRSDYAPVTGSAAFIHRAGAPQGAGPFFVRRDGSGTLNAQLALN